MTLIPGKQLKITDFADINFYYYSFGFKDDDGGYSYSDCSAVSEGR
jgi:hypothetical protein